MSSSNSNNNKDEILLNKALRLSALENERSKKRLQMETFYEQKLQIEAALQRLEAELGQLDEQIDDLDYDEDGDTIRVKLERRQEQERSDATVVVTTNDAAALDTLNTTTITTTTETPPYATASSTTNSEVPPAAKPAATLDTFLGVQKPAARGPTTTTTTSSAITPSMPTVQASAPFHTRTPQIHAHPFSTPAVGSPSPSSGGPFSDAQLQHTLETVFRIPSFRSHQREIIQATLKGRDVFCIMRTGGGKSLTYQLPAYLEGRCSPQRKITFVISPLLSLIHDQVQQMNEFCPDSAVAIVSKVGVSELAQRWRRIRDPNAGVCLVFCTPEKVNQSQKFLGELQKLYAAHRLGRCVIDEAHCATQYGHDFRPDYKELGKLKAHFGSTAVPVLAVTATASERVAQEVIRLLRLHQPLVLRSTAARPNLTYSVERKTSNGLQDIVDWIQAHYGDNTDNNAGIVYTLSKKDAETVTTYLTQHGIRAAPYHSEVRNKQEIQDSWMRNETQVVVATIAFGMGINKPDVRFVIHHALSKTLEAYYQESGRAGRDGHPARCVLYYSPKDVVRMYKLVHGGTTTVSSSLFPMLRYAQQAGNDAVCKAILLTHLGEPNYPKEVMHQVIRENEGMTVQRRPVGIHALNLARLLQERQKDLTMAMLVKEWRASTTAETTPQYIKDNPPAKDGLSVDDCERIILELLLAQVLKVNPQWTAYDTVIYFALDTKGFQLLQSPHPQVNVKLPIAAAAAKPRKAAPRSTVSTGEWLSAAGPQTKRKAAPKKKKAVAKTKKAKKAPVKKKRTTTTAPRKKRVKSSQEVIELLDDDDHDTQTEGDGQARDPLWDDIESDEEFEFDG